MPQRALSPDYAAERDRTPGRNVRSPRQERAASEGLTILSQEVDAEVTLVAWDAVRTRDAHDMVANAAAEGQVLATQVVRNLTEGKGLNWPPAPAIDAKGVEEPILVFSLDLDQPSPIAGSVMLQWTAQNATSGMVSGCSWARCGEASVVPVGVLFRPSRVVGVRRRGSRSSSCVGSCRRRSSWRRRTRWRWAYQWAGPRGQGRSGCH